MQERYIATADLGTSKIAICVARVEGENIQIIYYRETPSDGIRYSGVYNPKHASESLKRAINEAEDELKIKILQIVVGLPRYSVRQEINSAKIERSEPDEFITEEEIQALKSMALDSYPLDDPKNEAIYGGVAQSFSIDDMIQARESDIEGTTSATLEGNFKIFVGARKAIKNIDAMLNGLNIAPARKYFLPASTANAVLTDEEKENGVALVEIGAGVTSLTIYQGKIMRFYSAIPFGGKNITYDIKYECGFNEELAENIKLAFGACMPDKLQSLGDKIIRINDEETGTYEQLPVKYLSEIITARSKEIVEAVLYMIQASGFAERLRNGIVLTGGCANLANLSGMIKDMSGYNVRPGYPRRYFSAAGCPGIGETSAVASVGMVLAASRDYHLNCIEEALPEEPATPAGEDGGEAEPQQLDKVDNVMIEEVVDYGGSILDPTANIVKPSPKPKTDKKKFFTNIIWGGEQKPKPAKPSKPSFTDKLAGVIDKALDGESKVGSLFDSMGNN